MEIISAEIYNFKYVWAQEIKLVGILTERDFSWMSKCMMTFLEQSMRLTENC